jgi:oligopeptidase B
MQTGICFIVIFFGWFGMLALCGSTPSSKLSSKLPSKLSSRPLSKPSISRGNHLPPLAPVRPTTTILHGDTLVDNYAWLKQRSVATLKYLRAENAYTASVMRPTRRLQTTLFDEMRQRAREVDTSVQEQSRHYAYYWRTVRGKEYALYCRKPLHDSVSKSVYGSSQAVREPIPSEQVLLDVNALARFTTGLQLGALLISPDERLMVYATDPKGSNCYTARFKNLRTGTLLPDVLLNTGTTFAWSDDGASLFYTALDRSNRSYKVFRHTIGTPQSQDQEYLYEPDERCDLSLTLSRSGEYLFCYSESLISTQVYVLSMHVSRNQAIPQHIPEARFIVLAPRQNNVDYDVSHHGSLPDFLYLQDTLSTSTSCCSTSCFVIRTNDSAPNFRLMVVPVERCGDGNSRRYWQQLLAERADTVLEACGVYERCLVLKERALVPNTSGVSVLRVWDVRRNSVHPLLFQEQEHSITLAAEESATMTAYAHTASYFSPTLRFSYDSWTSPTLVMDYNVVSQSLHLVKRGFRGVQYNPHDYAVESLTAQAADGTAIPISLLYNKRAVKPRTPAPLWLEGYGAYGNIEEPYCSVARLSLLDRGVIVAIAHVRGNGTLGKAWHDAGKMANKHRSFHDFISVAEHLIQQGYTSPQQLIANGGSAGGLLVSAVATMRPDLFHGIIAEVPFVDVIHTMLDSTLPLTVGEFEEWGNPRHADEYRIMRSYSPYDNLRSQPYPHLLLTAGLYDTQVGFWEPAKFVAKLRRLQYAQRSRGKPPSATPATKAATEPPTLLLQTAMNTGHSGASGRFSALKEQAFLYAFALHIWGMNSEVAKRSGF